MPNATTPIARSKTAAMARVVDNVPRGYCRYTVGTVAASKAVAMANKLHLRYGIGCTPAQRITRKKHGQGNALLIMYWPDNTDIVHWLMLVTAGTGFEAEQLRDVAERRKPLMWLGYELTRYANRGSTSWTWRRQKSEMAEHYALIKDQLAKHYHGAVAETLQRVANQPGYHGVRAQSWAICQFARQLGYAGETPQLFFQQKISHGDRLTLNTDEPALSDPKQATSRSQK